MAVITGWAHSKFGKLEDETLESLITGVAADAIKHAEIEPGDIDAIYLGNFNGGFTEQGFAASLVSLADDALRYVPSTRVENACATGSAAIHQAINAIDAKRAKTVLVVAVEKMTEVSTRDAGRLLLRASYHKEEADIEGGFAGVFGQLAQAYFQKYGDQSAALARIAAKNHANGVHNPYAQMRKDLGFDFCNTVSDKNPLVAGPLRRTDCSLISDGAAAMVISDMDRAWAAPRAIGFRSATHVNDFLPLSRRDKTELAGAGNAWKQALDQSRLTLDDLSFVETHDCFTIAELMEYEAMGLAEQGQGHRVIEEGITEKTGKLPVNPSGGLKAKGHPVGATGVSMHAISCMQLMDEAGDMQIKDARLAGIFNMGGSSVANYVSILERLR
ncbi:MAG: acetyl-CoA acetyltransferase [Pseudomonadota bacterium]